MPMIVRWPAGLDGGHQIDALIHFTDGYRSLLNFAGIDRGAGLPLDGDILPVLRGEMLQRAPRRFWQWNGYTPIGTTNAAMRDGDWKLVRPADRRHPPPPPLMRR
ncbi:MAG: hypothetical protein R2867_38990 [Caldilineaceae bacterium]